MNKKKYQAPQMKSVQVNAQQMLCQSLAGSQNEKYVLGNTEGWYD